MLITALSTLAFTAVGTAQSVEKRETSEARAEATAEVNGEGGHYEKKTVTVTSENGRTVRKTTTVKDGVEQTVTELLDGEGKVTATLDDPEGSAAGDTGDDPAPADSGPWIGLRVQEAPAALRDQLGLGPDEGVVVDAVAPDGPAAKAGLKVNDLLLKLDQTPLGKPEDLRTTLQDRQAGETVVLSYMRKGTRDEAGVTLGEKPAGAPADGKTPPPRDQGGKAGKTEAGKQGEGGSIQVEVSGSNGLDAVLNDPNVPEDFKKTVREMRERMQRFQEEHGIDRPQD
jgi:C-terminal processing protease CtpA/Prc